MKNRAQTDQVRASRDGHEYHEAWTARKALQLLNPNDSLFAIAIEGLSPSDQANASAEAVEIADTVLYYGKFSNFQNASQTSFAQFKHSVANADKDFRASDAKKTVEKFAKVYCELKQKHGAKAVQDKLDFQLITNQPIYAPFKQAVDYLARGLILSGEVQKQAKQFESAANLDARSLAEFASKFKLLGRSPNLPATKNEISSLVVDWSATSDPIAIARLGLLKELVRNKASSAGTGQNLIMRTDILSVLGIGDPDDLLPCKTALPEVENIIAREQVVDALTLIPKISSPLLIHASGGVGKTVFMESLARKISEHHEVVFFDCFGGGSYRSLEDSRHLPNKGLVHIANTLAFKGLCDPILPSSTDIQALFKTFRRRLIQCINTISNTVPGRQLALFIDAIDNADIAAKSQNEASFPIKLLEALHAEPIAGLKIIVSCRTERKPSTYANYSQFELRPFSIKETSEFLKARLCNISEGEINVAQARSDGNPRVLDYLAISGNGFLDTSEINKKLVLDELIQKRISDALAETIKRGCKNDEIDVFLAGLAVLPPPVPLDEYASIQGIQLSAVKSFASDLSPLLERSNQGLMFRDEPTETLIHAKYASSKDILRRIADNLLDRQDTSVYAARSLPGLLQQLNDGERLFTLAFDDRIPKTITSTVGKRNVRYARLKAATLDAAINKDYNRLVRLLVELSAVAAIDQRGAEYILGHPDLVVAAKDDDATRRLFELRTSWPGTRHARLTIANTLYGEFQEAYRHGGLTNDWIGHYYRTDQKERFNEPGPGPLDIAAIPFFLISKGRANHAAGDLERWQDAYTFEISEYIFDYSRLAQMLSSQDPSHLIKFVDSLKRIGPLTAALSFQELSKKKCKDLVIKIVRATKGITNLNFSDHYDREHTYRLQDGLRKVAAIALSLGLRTAALKISRLVPHQRPDLWSFGHFIHHRYVFPSMFQLALEAAAHKKTLCEKDVLPTELVSICSSISKRLTGKEFQDEAKKILAQKFSNKSEGPDKLSYDQHQESQRFLERRLEPFCSLTKALSNVLASPPSRINKNFIEFLNAWEDARKNRDPYQSRDMMDLLFCRLGFDAALFILWAREELTPASVSSFISKAHAQGLSAPELIKVVSILAKRPKLHGLAGAEAIEARKLIQDENDVEHRAALFGRLGRAMLPASIEEASVYFRDGLEQMDAIGSGDSQFTNELLLFASSLKGGVLEEQDFHTLSNICELNLGEEPEKFFWGAYGGGFSKAAGLPGLAKLSRWDDRSKISLGNTLLPYLIALLEDEKITPQDALALNRLASPVDYYYSGTKEFSQKISEKAGSNPAIISELIQQFLDNNPGVPMHDTVEELYRIAKDILGTSSEMTKYLSESRQLFPRVRDVRNEQMNYRSLSESQLWKNANKVRQQNLKELNRIAKKTDPTKAASLAQAMGDFSKLQNTYDLKGDFFASLRSKVPFAGRSQYVKAICEQEELVFYWKIDELKECKNLWGKSSAAIGELYKQMAIPFIHLHANDLIDNDRLSNSNIKEIACLCGISVPDLLLELIKILSQQGNVAGAVWLAFAALVCPQADAGQGQIALKKLLGSEAAKLANNVTDGPWSQGLYPGDDISTVASGLIWRALGSTHAEDRWHAAHSIRCFAKFGRWEVIEHLVRNIEKKDAGSFQASELKFYFLHASLWLLISLSRIAIGYPKEIAQFKDILISIALEKNNPHVLLCHFAAKALVACLDAGELNVSGAIEQSLRNIDKSRYPIKKRSEHDRHTSQKPHEKPTRKIEFCIDIDFQKDVDSLSRVFGKPAEEVSNILSEKVKQIDPKLNSMYDSGGRKPKYRHSSFRMGDRHHGYGQQLGWHALFFAAGKLLGGAPVIEDSYDEDPWGEWLSRYLLTRNDGLWLSEGTDKMPIGTAEILLERREKDLGITGDSKKILSVVGISNRIGKEIVVEGRWRSPDNVEVRISSSLVPPKKAAQFARSLTQEQAFNVWIPMFYETENTGHDRDDRREYSSWILCFSGEAKLDEHDPYSVPYANSRSRLARDCSDLCLLTSDDPFRRNWKDRHGKILVRSEVWGREDKDNEEGSRAGHRLLCSPSALKRILTKKDKDLLLLINLQRYEKRHQESSKWTNTVAVVHITKALNFKYFKGYINHLHESRY